MALNAPKMKGSANLTYRNLSRGLNAEARVRYTDEFPANSAGSTSVCPAWDSSLQGDCVQSFTLVDLTAGYRLPVTGATLQFTISNLLDEDYQSFIGVPTMGRMAVLRLKYDL